VALLDGWIAVLKGECVSVRHHVAFIVNNYPPHVGGVERHVASLARELVRQGHHATVITLANEPGIAQEDGIDVVRLRRWLPVASVFSLPFPGTTRNLASKLAGLEVTVISTHTRFFPMSMVGIRLGRRLRLPVVHTEHGSGFVKGVSPVVGIASRLVDLTLGRYVLRTADRVLAVSESVSVFVARLSSATATIFHNAINVAEWTAAAPDFSRATDRLVFMGRLVPGKGWDVLLSAVELMRADSAAPVVTVDILGDGPERSHLERVIAERELGDIVTVHGYVSGTQRAELLSGSVLVNPTTLAEGFQTSLVEALAAGSRVVTFDVPGAQLLADDGAPIAIVKGNTALALSSAIRDELVSPRPLYDPEKLQRWDWASRSLDYVAVLDEVVGPRE
jgi:glycosyltransferase involved in cell wall biosynthesis